MVKNRFHYPIFQGVKADDYQNPTHRKAINNLLQGFGQTIEFLVDGDTKRLKYPGGRVDTTGMVLLGNRPVNQIRQFLSTT
jgi:hypothetical protein